MSAAEGTRLRLKAGAPEVWLLDAERAAVDEHALRAWARARTMDAPYSSRSYRYPLALLARHDAPVGVDLERAEPLDNAIADTICTPDERERVSQGIDLASLWSSKEALSKALGDPVRYDPRRLGAPMLWPDGRSGPWRAVPLAVPPGYTAWVCWRDRTGP